jgi:hypothetical protein
LVTGLSTVRCGSGAAAKKPRYAKSTVQLFLAVAERETTARDSVFPRRVMQNPVRSETKEGLSVTLFVSSGEDRAN